MTDERMVEELAIIDGVDVSGGIEFVESDGSYQTRLGDSGWYIELDNYLFDANATKRIVRGMDIGTRLEYKWALRKILNCYKEPSLILAATVRQEAEAILKARGTWEKG